VVRRFKRNADKSWTVTLADADNRRQSTAGANKDKFGFNNPLLTTVVGIREGHRPALVGGSWAPWCVASSATPTRAGR
jgi:hypothetical protein